MPLSATTPTTSLSPLVKMEDRKRPALSGADDIAPPSKRQAVNGAAAKASKDDDTKEEAWIEVSRSLASPSPTPQTIPVHSVSRRSAPYSVHWVLSARPPCYRALSCADSVSCNCRRAETLLTIADLVLSLAAINCL